MKTATFDGIKLAKTVSKFKREILNPKLEKTNGINYKTAFRLFTEINEIIGFEIIKFEAQKETLHNYKVSGRVRYNDTYKDGYNIKVSFLNKKYEAHNKDNFSAYNFANWIDNNFGDIFRLVKEIRQSL